MAAPPASQEQAISPAVKAELEDWGTKTTVGVFAGMLYGGLREAAGSARVEQSRLPFPQEDKLKQRKAVREMMENKVLRIARGTVLGGAKLGAFTALFNGVQHALAVYRNGHDTYNMVAAGGITGAAFSFTLPGSLQLRATSAALGSLFGAAICVPLGLVQTALHDELGPLQEREARKQSEAMAVPVHNTGEEIDAVIRRLETRVPDQLAKPRE